MKRILTDSFGRPHTYLRISLTDKCNLACAYCSPVLQQTEKINSSSQLSVDELDRIMRIFVEQFGIKKIRFTGGEPLVRKDILDIFNRAHQLKQENDFELCLTSNGIFFADKIRQLKKLGLDSVNISLDSLNQKTFYNITGKDGLALVLESIDKVEALGFDPVKVNTVIIRNVNDNELLDFVSFAAERNINIRFIEFMPFANNNWNEEALIPFEEMKQRIETKFRLLPLQTGKHAVAKNFSIEGKKGTVSFITSMSEHFCGDCNRLRVTASGFFKVCLFSEKEKDISLIPLLRNNAVSDKEIADRIYLALQNKNFAHASLEELQRLDKNNMIAIGG